MKNCCFTYYGELFSEGGECPSCPEVGSIQIHRGIDQGLYSDQSGAENYLVDRIDGTCSKVYLDSTNDVLFFDVPHATYTYNGFLNETIAYIIQKNDYLYYGDECFVNNGGNNIIDGLGGYIYFGNSCFVSSFGNNYISKAIASNDFFAGSSGNNTIDYCEAVDSCFAGSSGNNKIAEFIGIDNSFRDSSGNNTIGDGTFGESAFLDAASSLNTITNIIDANDNFGKGYIGNFMIRGDIGATDSDDLIGTASFFDAGGSANLIVQLTKLTSNAGLLEGDLANAVINGATVNCVLT
jgi:hypothetical protein